MNLSKRKRAKQGRAESRGKAEEWGERKRKSKKEGWGQDRRGVAKGGKRHREGPTEVQEEDEGQRRGPRT